jgi:hypothetical protein
LVPSFFFPLRYEFQMVQQMRRLPAWLLVVEMRLGEAILALRVWVQVGKVVAAAMGWVAVVVQTAVGGGALRGVRKAGVEGQW